MPAVHRWQRRIRGEGVAGLLHDKTRPSRIPPLAPALVERVAAMMLRGPPGAATHWSSQTMAAASGVSASSVRRIWRAHGLQPHRVRRFKLSRDPRFVEKVQDVVGLYIDPPRHALVLSADEKSQIQAVERTQPGLPMADGAPATQTHDYTRHGTTTLFAALSLLDGTVFGHCAARHRYQEFIHFLGTVEVAVPVGQEVHVVLDKLCHPQASEGAGVTGEAPALGLPLHPDLGLMAECGRELLRQAHPQAPALRQLPQHRRASGRHQQSETGVRRRSLGHCGKALTFGLVDFRSRPRDI